MPDLSSNPQQALQNNKENQMEKLAQNIQEAFLNNARKDKIFLTIYLMSGVKLSGRIKSFDKYSVILETNNQEQLIFKHAISTVVMSRPLHGAMAHGASATSPGAPATAADQPEHNP
jgi:host factor-I protein